MAPATKVLVYDSVIKQQKVLKTKMFPKVRLLEDITLTSSSTNILGFNQKDFQGNLEELRNAKSGEHREHVCPIFSAPVLILSRLCAKPFHSC